MSGNGEAGRTGTPRRATVPGGHRSVWTGSGEDSKQLRRGDPVLRTPPRQRQPPTLDVRPASLTSPPALESVCVRVEPLAPFHLPGDWVSSLGPRTPPRTGPVRPVSAHGPSVYRPPVGIRCRRPETRNQYIVRSTGDVEDSVQGTMVSFPF